VTGDRGFKRLSPLTPLVRGFILVVAVAGTSWDDLLRGDVGPIAALLIALLAAGAVYGAVSWWRTKYWIEVDELRVETGVLARQSRRIRVDRLQGVDVAQPFVARLFGLAELRMDVAGGAHEGSLAFLPLEEAHRLREELLSRRDVSRAARTVPEGSSGSVDPSGSPVAADAGAPESVVATLGLRTLVLSILLSSETIGFLVTAALFAGSFAVVGGLGGLAGATPVLLGWVLSQFRKLAAYHGFTVAQTPAGLQVRRGLFDRSAQTITLDTVQGVVVSEPWLWRRAGWARLDVSVAGRSSGGGGPSTSTIMPVAEVASIRALARLVLTGPDPFDTELRPVPGRARWVSPVHWRTLHAGADEHLVVSRDGLLTRRTHAVPHARVQSLRVRQGPWQRRLGLADLIVDSPPGPVRVRARHRAEADARRLLERENRSARTARRGRPGP
jgi:putative membrane protein